MSLPFEEMIKLPEREQKEIFDRVVRTRKTYKPVNYSSVYGIGKAKLARELKTTEKEAKKLLEAYWGKNWSVKVVASSCSVKTIYGQMWLLNPVSKFYYSLRFEKDRFSTLNQGTGVYCFDQWVREIKRRRKQMTAQFHDEIVAEIKQGHQEAYSAILYEAIDAVNERLQLNVPLKIGEPQYGPNYAAIH